MALAPESELLEDAMLRSLLLVFCLAAAPAAAGEGWLQNYRQTTPPKPAPEAAFIGPDGGEITLDRFRGKETQNGQQDQADNSARRPGDGQSNNAQRSPHKLGLRLNPPRNHIRATRRIAWLRSCNMRYNHRRVRGARVGIRTQSSGRDKCRAAPAGSAAHSRLSASAAHF